MNPTLRTPLATPAAPATPTRPGTAPLPDSAPQRVPRKRAPESLSLVLPCYNEAASLAQLLPALQALLPSLGLPWEVVLVDDGSRDATPALLLQWSHTPGFRVLQLSRNFGKEAALSAGLQAARGQVVLLMDADGQHSPALIPEFLARWAAGADVVYATRAHRRDEGPVKRWGSKAFYALLNAADRFTVPADAGDFRLLDRRVVQALLQLPERTRFMKGLYAWVGFDAVALPYMPAPRLHGHSRFGPLRLLQLSLDGLTAFTTWPLRAVSAIGFGLALLALGYGAYLTADYMLNGHGVSGWTTIVVSLMLLSGIQLISLGVVGEYVGRVFAEVKQRPLFVVRHEFGRSGIGPAA
jgi:glycosyltransferase involved in cell wall biosynthesis